MTFNSLAYLPFLAAVLVCYWTLSGRVPARVRLGFLLLVGYLFYSFSNPVYLLLLLALTLINFFSGRQIRRAEANRLRQKHWVSFAVVASLSILGALKYYNFFQANFIALSHSLGWEFTLPAASWALPLGISFYTFQSLSYTLDVYRGTFPAGRSFLDFAAYVAFFPPLLAGPINRAGALLPQLQAEPRFRREQVLRGLFQLLAGLVKKLVFADLIAHALVNEAFSHPESVPLPLAWLAMYGYTLQIYSDFSGYSDAAIGTARMLGIELAPNFNRPYQAQNPREFWRRWHISLSTWLRDYLYFSLGGSRAGRPRMFLALFLTMLLGGLWHGAGWNFILWGAYHGVLLMAHRLGREIRSGRPAPPLSRIRRALSWALTFHLVALGWVIFRAENSTDALVLISRLVTGQWTGEGIIWSGVGLMVMGYALHFTPSRWRDQGGEIFVRLPTWVQGAALAAVIALISLMEDVTSPFIYFKF